MRLLGILLLTAALAFGARNANDAVKAAEKAWAVATVAGDEAALNNLLWDELSYTHSTGDIDTKAMFIGNIKSGARRYHKVEHESMTIRVYENTAVLSATARVVTSQNGGPESPAHLRFLHVWVFLNGRWQLVAHQSLRLAQ